MSSRYDELERLQRLRESGALTDEEFQAEKARILGVAMAPPEPGATDEEEEQEEAPPSRRPLYLALGGVALILAVAAGLFLGRMVGEGSEGGAENVAALPETSLADENLIAPPAVPDVRTLPPEQQLVRAFETAFASRGSAARTIDGASFTFAPGAMRWIGSRAVLVSPGTGAQDCHACPGRIAVHYLEPEAGGFRVVGEWIEAMGAWGKPPNWGFTSLLSPQPMLRTSIRDGGQGYFCSVTNFYEFGPEGLREVADVQTGYSDTGAIVPEEDKEATEIEGKIANVVRGRSFDVIYTGSRSFAERYERRGDRYVLASGESQLPTC
jgi:hypothetical protein